MILLIQADAEKNSDFLATLIFVIYHPIKI